jgi:predicted aminopeptidase
VKRRRFLVVFLVAIGLLMAGYGAAYLSSDEVRYLSRAGLEETRILQARRPIDKVAADSSADPEVRAAMHLVLATRDYAAELGLDAKETYTTYTTIPRDTLLLVLTAAPRNCLCPYTWKYPIVGRVPYKGFFDQAVAVKEADRLGSRGYDIYLRPAAAFSTLGWFNDPLLSTAIDKDSSEMAALVLHEIAHNTLYVKGATPFNESFAQLVGYRGAESFFRRAGDTVNAQRAADRWEDEVVLSGFYGTLSAKLDSLYQSAPDSAAVDRGREEAGRWARAELEGPVAARLKTYRIGNLGDRPVNNARIIGARIYRTRLDLFEAYYEAHNRDVAETVAALKVDLKDVPGDSAYAVLERAVHGTLTSPPR